MKRLIFTLVVIMLSLSIANAQARKDELGVVVLETNDNGKFYQYAPQTMRKTFRFLVVVHGMVGPNGSAVQIAKSYTELFKRYADKYGVVLIVPVFDKYNFGSYEGPLGGYRGLAGREIGADVFLNQIMDSYQDILEGYDGRFAILGHSAGGQFVNRYIAKHPERVTAARIIAPGSYMFFNDKVEFPWGIGRCWGYNKWDGSEERQTVDFTPDREKLKEMLSLDVRVVVGSKDTYRNAPWKGQVGTTRIERARNWVLDAERYAKSVGVEENVSFVLVEGAGHGCSKLFSEAVKGLFPTR